MGFVVMETPKSGGKTRGRRGENLPCPGFQQVPAKQLHRRLARIVEGCKMIYSIGLCKIRRENGPAWAEPRLAEPRRASIRMRIFEKLPGNPHPELVAVAGFARIQRVVSEFFANSTA